MRTTTTELGVTISMTLHTGVADIALLPIRQFAKWKHQVKANGKAILFVGLTHATLAFMCLAVVHFLLGTGYASILVPSAPIWIYFDSKTIYFT